MVGIICHFVENRQGLGRLAQTCKIFCSGIKWAKHDGTLWRAMFDKESTGQSIASLGGGGEQMMGDLLQAPCAVAIRSAAPGVRPSSQSNIHRFLGRTDDKFLPLTWREKCRRLIILG